MPSSLSPSFWLRARPERAGSNEEDHCHRGRAAHARQCVCRNCGSQLDLTTGKYAEGIITTSIPVKLGNIVRQGGAIVENGQSGGYGLANFGAAAVDDIVVRGGSGGYSFSSGRWKTTGTPTPLTHRSSRPSPRPAIPRTTTQSDGIPDGGERVSPVPAAYQAAGGLPGRQKNRPWPCVADVRQRTS